MVHVCVGPLGGLLGILLPASWLGAKTVPACARCWRRNSTCLKGLRLPRGPFAHPTPPRPRSSHERTTVWAGLEPASFAQVSQRDLESFFSGGAATAGYYRIVARPCGGSPAPSVSAEVRPLAEFAEILSGPQPLSNIRDRGHGIPYLNQISAVAPYGLVEEHVLWHVLFPDDFQGKRGASIIHRKKVLASAARGPRSPWRFRVAVDVLGIAARNSVRGVAPHDQDDENLLYALAIIIGSGFASIFAASLGGDRNILGRRCFRRYRSPRPHTLDVLSVAGRRAAALSHDKPALNAHLTLVEDLVWDAYGVSETDRITSRSRLAGVSRTRRATTLCSPAQP